VNAWREYDVVRYFTNSIIVAAFVIIFTILILLRNNYAISNFIRDLDSVFSPYKDVDFNGKNIFALFSLPDDIIDRMVELLPLII